MMNTYNKIRPDHQIDARCIEPYNVSQHFEMRGSDHEEAADHTEDLGQ
jgi:hypothetical protein